MCRFIFPKFNFKIEKWKWNEEYRVYVSSLGHFKDEHKRNIPVKISSKTGYCNIMTACLKNTKQIVKKENVIEKIKKSIQYGNTYCGLKWKIKKIRKEDKYVN